MRSEALLIKSFTSWSLNSGLIDDRHNLNFSSSLAFGFFNISLIGVALGPSSPALGSLVSCLLITFNSLKLYGIFPFLSGVPL